MAVNPSGPVFIEEVKEGVLDRAIILLKEIPVHRSSLDVFSTLRKIKKKLWLTDFFSYFGRGLVLVLKISFGSLICVVFDYFLRHKLRILLNLSKEGTVWNSIEQRVL